MTDEFTDWDGAYVVGALAPEDRRRYELHLTGCADCARAVQELAGLPGILGALGTEEAVALSGIPDDHLRGAVHRPDRTAATAKRLVRHRRRSRLLLAGALVMALAAGSAGGFAIASAGDATAPRLAAARTLHPVGGSELSADLSVTPVGWGTRLDWSCDYHGQAGDTAGTSPQPVSYSLVVHTAGGGSQTVATWTSEGGEAKHLVASTAIPADSISRVDIRVTGSETALAQG